MIENKKYNFQNLNSAKEALLWVSGIDIFKLLKKHFSEDKIKNIFTLVDLRHKIVHEAFYDKNITWKDITKYHSFWLNVGVILYYELIIKKEEQLKKKKNN